jgi:hypothetical protein
MTQFKEQRADAELATSLNSHPNLYHAIAILSHATLVAEYLSPNTSQLNMQTSHGEYMLVDENALSTQDQRPEVHVPNHGHPSEEFT